MTRHDERHGRRVTHRRVVVHVVGFVVVVDVLLVVVVVVVVVVGFVVVVVARIMRAGGGVAQTSTSTTVRVELGAEAQKATGDAKKMPPKESFWRVHKEELRELVPYLWPAGEPLLRVMFAASVAFLLASKGGERPIAPIALKTAVDRISRGDGRYLTPIVLYGGIRFGVSLCSELKDNCFSVRGGARQSKNFPQSLHARDGFEFEVSHQ